jgi:hypothetical protein
MTDEDDHKPGAAAAVHQDAAACQARCLLWTGKLGRADTEAAESRGDLCATLMSTQWHHNNSKWVAGNKPQAALHCYKSSGLYGHGAVKHACPTGTQIQSGAVHRCSCLR